MCRYVLIIILTMTLALNKIRILSTPKEKAHPCNLSSGKHEKLFQVFWFQRSYAARTLSSERTVCQITKEHRWIEEVFQ